MNLPKDFLLRMEGLFDQKEYQEFIESYDKERYYGLRQNPLKRVEGSLSKLLDMELRPVEWCKEGYYYDGADRPGRHVLHEAGAYYIQEPSAMSVAALLEAKPGEKVLDLCSAPGGKTTQIAGDMQGQGLLVSNEYVASRAKILAQNVERMGIRNCVVLNETPQHLAQVFAGFFDKILVDAPCSGEGMFRKEEGAIDQWSLENVDICSKRQREILECAVQMLAPGGRLVYSTCTFAPQEDEEITQWLLKTYSFLNICPINKVGGMEDGRTTWAEGASEEVKHAARLWPHRLQGEGHYVAVFASSLEKKKDPQTEEFSPFVDKKKKRKDFTENCRQTFDKFAKECLNLSLEGRYELFGNRIYLVPKQMVSLEGLKVYRAGLELGEEKKGRFEPAHALAMALKKEEVKESFEMSSQASNYIHGEVIYEEAPKGWILMTVCGISLGWGKSTGTQIKNHYPKGLRK